jgi:threonine/homoserine/homoserine lactone efflux protein
MNNLIMTDIYVAVIPALIALAAATISPGPNTFATVAATLGSGRRAGITVAIGIGCGGLVWGASGSLGLTALLAAFPQATIILALLGSAYLGYLAYKGFRSALIGGAPAMGAKSVGSMWAAWRLGFFATLTNPKAGLMWLSVSSVVALSVTSNLAVVAFVLAGASIVFLVYGSMAVIFSISSIREGYQRYHRWADGAFGLAFTVLAILLLQRFIF